MDHRGNAFVRLGAAEFTIEHAIKTAVRTHGLTTEIGEAYEELKAATDEVIAQLRAEHLKDVQRLTSVIYRAPGSETNE